MAKRRIQGEGSIFQIKSGPKTGQFVGQITIGWGSDGKRRVKSVYADTQRECSKRLDKLKIELSQGLIDDNSKLSDWITYWLDEICPTRIAKKTLYEYKGKMRLYVLPIIGSIKLKNLRPDDIREVEKVMRTDGAAHSAKARWDEAVAKHGKDSSQAKAAEKRYEEAKAAGKGLSETTVRQVHVILSRCLKVAEREGKIRRNPAAMIDAPSIEINPDEVLTVEDAKKVLRGAKDERDLARLTCALVMGIRQGEALALKWDDVDFTSGTLRVDESVNRIPGEGFVTKAPKSKASKRTIPLPDPVAAVLKAWYAKTAGESDYVFPGLTGGPEGQKRDWKAWSEALDRAGVEHVKLHGARGTASSLLEEMGVPDRVIADILGHADVKVTLMHYIHSTEQQRGNALDGLARELAIAPLAAK